MSLEKDLSIDLKLDASGSPLFRGFGIRDASSCSMFGSVPSLSDNPFCLASPLKKGRRLFSEHEPVSRFGHSRNPVIEEQVIANDDGDKQETYDCDVVFSFDTTGSMRSIIKSVRENLVETIYRLFIEIPNIRIGIIVHGDYCDSDGFFWKLDLNRNKEQLKKFITNAKDTGGGDAPEAYEFAIKQAATMNWKSEVKVLVMIGDQKPHEKGYTMPYKYDGFTNNLHIDWKEEMQKCKDNHITIFSCHALPEQNSDALYFYHTISKHTGGYYFPLSELQSFPHYMVTICMKAGDAAEDLKMLREKQAQLQELIDNNKLKPNEAEAIKTEISEIDKTLSIAATDTVFSPELLNYSSKIRLERGISTRVETYINEVRSSNKTTNIFRTKSAE